MTITYELQIWLKQRHDNALLGIPDDVLKFSNKRKALLNFDTIVKTEKRSWMQNIEHMVLMEYGANEEFPDDGDVVAEW